MADLRFDASTPRAKFLLVCSLVSLPYRVLRVAEAGGADVYVLGRRSAQGIRYSRFCKKFVLSTRPISGGRDPDLAVEINRCIAEFGIQMVLPGDARATRALLAIKELLRAPCFPSPDLRQFDWLNNKWDFTKLCMSLDIKCPRTWLVLDGATLKSRLEHGKIPRSVIAKPVDSDGGFGFVKLDTADAAALSAKIAYRPIIVQEFIPGVDIGASVFCQDGEIRAWIAHELTRATYRCLDDPRILTTLSRIMRHVRADGVFNFDMRLAPDGTIFYLECNPRFFAKINMSMMAGVNFIGEGLNAGTASVPARAVGDVRMPKALALALCTPWRVTARDIRMFWHLWGDPVFHLREMLFGIDHDQSEGSHLAGLGSDRMQPISHSDVLEIRDGCEEASAAAP